MNRAPRGMVAIGWKPTFMNPHTGEIFSDTSASTSVGYDVGDDEIGDDEIGDDVGEIGDEDRFQRRYNRRQSRRGRRDDRFENRWEKRASRRGYDLDDDEAPKMKKSPTRNVPIGANYTVSAAGAWSITITPPVAGVIADLIMTYPAGTYVNNVATGLNNAVNGQTIAADVFAATSISRDLVKGLRVQSGVPVTISGTTTATSGTINASLSIATHDNVC